MTSPKTSLLSSMIKYIPNALTIFRFILVPIYIFLIIPDNIHLRIIGLFIFIFTSITDFLDGYLARKLKVESEFGKILDPLADKFLVISTICAFIYLDRQIPLWMVLVIISRDILITLMRYFGSKKRIEIRTSRLAKAKTAFQMISIIIILVIFTVRSYRENITRIYHAGRNAGHTNIEIAFLEFKKGIQLWPKENTYSKKKEIKLVFAQSIPYFLMLFVTILTIVSGIRYAFTNYRVFLRKNDNAQLK